MADKLWHTSFHVNFENFSAPGAQYQHVASTTQGQGGWAYSFAGSWNTYINFKNGSCTFDANGVAVSNTTSNYSVLLVGECVPLALNCYTDTRVIGRGCMEFFVNYTGRSSTGILMHSSGGIDGNDLADQVGWPDNAIEGFQVRVSATNELVLYMGNWADDAVPVDAYPTGLFISSGVKHFFIQFDGETLPARTTVGLDGDTFTVFDVPQAIGREIALGSSRTTFFVSQAVGVSATFNDWRATQNAVRYGPFIQGVSTYTPPTIGYPTFAVPAAPLTVIHSANGFTDIPNGEKLRLDVVSVSGGTPPYTYQWADANYGGLDWLDPDDPSYAKKQSIIIDSRKLSESDIYYFCCLITDAVGTVATTLTSLTQESWLYGASFQTNILDTIVYANVGDPILLNPTMVDNGKLLGWGPTRPNPHMLYQWPLFALNPDKIPIADVYGGSGNGYPVASYDGQAGVITPYQNGYQVNTTQGLEYADSFFIPSVQAEDDGLEIVYDYFYESTIATLTLRVVGEERSVGWWKTLIQTVQTAPLDYTESNRYKSFDEGVQSIVDFIAGPDYGDSGQYNLIDYKYNLYIDGMGTFNPSPLTEYDLGRYSQWRAQEYSQDPSTDYPISAELAWLTTGPYNAGRSLAVNAAYWHVNYFYPDCGPWKLTNNGSEFTKVFQVVYEATWDGAMDGKADIAAANPQYTSRVVRDKYVGTPFEQEYIDRYMWGYDLGYAL